MKPGEKKEVIAKPKGGYSVIDPKLRLTLERSLFPKDADIQVGLQFQAELTKKVESAVFTILSVDGEKVAVDGNTRENSRRTRAWTHPRTWRRARLE